MTLPGHYRRPKFLLAFIILHFFAGLTLAQNSTRRQAIASVWTDAVVGSFVGFANFSQEKPESPVTVLGRFNITEKQSTRGVHVHSFGDLSLGCSSVGLHFNPTNSTHGGPTDTVRHAGDLGTITSDDSGFAMLNITLGDTLLSLFGDAYGTPIGSAIVIHQGTDDLGKGNESDSLTTGHAGGRFACGIIGKVNTSAPPT